ncbi:hypothetical protein AAFF_G00284200 [Aldrovandia affinis]|uniref:Uncharacterized protein n=1 Tax=Aldrovandia affinis TaxID=143900 RepID=A0AAD7X1Y5_9TELE|nr:hypothetical protein AAFF_G00284200 [Aldrovandia affinis]
MLSDRAHPAGDSESGHHLPLRPPYQEHSAPSGGMVPGRAPLSGFTLVTAAPANSGKAA